MNTLLEINNVTYTYHTKNGETTAIENLKFNVKDKEFVSIVGPSGCGKTTILSIISGLISPTRGQTLLNGKKIEKPCDNIGYMLQKDQLFPWRTIEKNVFLPLEVKKLKDENAKNYGRELLIKYGLKDFLKSYPDELSGGMRQRVALIRTLVSKPDLLLLDEPFSALDSKTRLSVSNDVYKIIRAENKTAILVTHDISEAISMSDRVIVLTERPSKVKNEHVISLSGSSPINKRENPEFSKWFEILYKELDANEK